MANHFDTHSIQERYAVLWSGGKDSCFALWQAKQSGLRVEGLVNFFDEESDRVRFHAVRAPLVVEQARLLGLEIFQYGTNPHSYAMTFLSALHKLRTLGYTGVIAGDLHLDEVRRWNEEQAGAAGLKLIEPLWHSGGLPMLEAFVEVGFRAVITCSSNPWADNVRVGRVIDDSFIADVSSLSDFDVCGENGEYHSFVFDGPLFSEPVKWSLGEVRSSNGFSQIDLISPSEV